MAASSNSPLGLESTTSTLEVLPSTFTLNSSNTYPDWPLPAWGYFGAGAKAGLGMTSLAATAGAALGAAGATALCLSRALAITCLTAGLGAAGFFTSAGVAAFSAAASSFLA